MSATVELGLGIIGLGKPWGHIPGEVPPERDAIELLEFAYSTGIRYFDSAPSYGIAEERLGKFLHSLTRDQRAGLRIATKFGEHWNPEKQEPFVDHSLDALRRSLDRSLEHLGHIDVLQLHKTTPDALRSPDLAAAWDYATSLGIPLLGASVSDLESAQLAIGNQRYGCLQFPLNSANPKFAGVIPAAAARAMWIATNRPFAMGALLHGRDAFRFILRHPFNGVVLTGTRSQQHLLENWTAFQFARENP